MGIGGTAEGLVDGDEAGGGEGFAGDALFLEIEQGPFGVEDADEVGDAIAIALAGEDDGFEGGVFCGLEMEETAFFLGEGDEAVLGFLEGEEDGLFVDGEGALGAGVGGADALADATEVEGGPGELRAETPGIGAGLVEAGESIGFEADAAVEGDAGEEIGGFDADAGGGGGEGTFCGADIGAALEEFTGIADLEDIWPGGERSVGGEFGSEDEWREAAEDGDAVGGLGEGGFDGGNGGEGGAEEGLGAGDIELGTLAAIAEGFGEAEGIGLVGGVAAGDDELGLEAAEFEVIDGEFGAEGDEDIEAGGFDGIDGGAGGFDGAADAAPEVEFPGGIEAGAIEFVVAEIAVEVGVEGDGTAAGLGVAIGGIAAGGGGEVESGEGPEFAGFAEACGGEAQVWVVGGSLGDETFEEGIVEAAPPVDLDGGGGGAEVGAEGIGAGRRGWAIAGSDGTADDGEEEQADDEGMSPKEGGGGRDVHGWELPGRESGVWTWAVTNRR